MLAKGRDGGRRDATREEAAAGDYIDKGGGAMQKWCVVCALEYNTTFLGEASKICEVGRK